MDAIDQLHNKLKATAQRLGMQVSDGSIQLLQRRFAAEHLSELFGAKYSSIEEDVEDFPGQVQAVTIGHHRLLLGEIGPNCDRTVIAETVRRFHNQAIVAKSWLGSCSDDLQIFFVAPVGSNEQAEWHSTKAEVERNERVCRKMIWLPPETIEARDDSLNYFISRTFLARPWADRLSHDQEALDAMANLFTAIADDDFTEDLARRWLDLLTSDGLDREILVKRLVEVLQSQS